MFKLAMSKIPALFLAIAVCFMTASGPLRVVILSQGTETETADLLEAKEICSQHFDARRLRTKHHQHPVYLRFIQEEPRETEVLADVPRKPHYFSQSPPPLLRAPPIA